MDTPRGVWVLRAHPVAGNSAPGLSLLAHVLQGGYTHKGVEGLALWCCRSAWPGRCRPAPGGSRACRAGAGGRCRGAAGRPGCAAPARPARGAAVAGRAAAGRRRAGRGHAGRCRGAAGRPGHLAVLRGGAKDGGRANLPANCGRQREQSCRTGPGTDNLQNGINNIEPDQGPEAAAGTEREQRGGGGGNRSGTGGNRKDRTPSLFSLLSRRIGPAALVAPVGGVVMDTPRGVWVLRAHPVAGNSAPGLSLLAHAPQGGVVSVGNRARDSPGLSLWRTSADTGERCASGCLLPPSPARGAAVAGRAAAGRRRAGQGRGPASWCRWLVPCASSGPPCRPVRWVRQPGCGGATGPAGPDVGTLRGWRCWPGRRRAGRGRAGPAAGGRRRGAAGQPGCAAPARPARGAAVAGRAAAGRRRAGRG